MHHLASALRRAAAGPVAPLFSKLSQPSALTLAPHARSFGVMDTLRNSMDKQKEKKMNEKRRAFHARVRRVSA